VRVESFLTLKNGIAGRRVKVTVHGEDEAEAHGHGHGHAHRSLAEILALIDGFELPERVKADAKAVYELIARAEGRVHGREPGEVHFHEVGALDAVADVTGVCLLMYELGAERVAASPVRVGYGTVRCAHGELPVPAPATALLLEGVPVYAGDIEGEFCTPTGAALVKYFAGEFGPMPELTVERSGFGMGTRDYERVNGLRAIVGEAAERLPRVAELRCNLDDIRAEDLAFAQELLLERGALDVYTLPLGMKKGRAGVMLGCLCEEERREEFAALMLRHTPTLGLRVYHPERITLSRRTETVETQFGELRVKYAQGRGVEKSKPEFDDLKRMALESGLSLDELRRRLGL
jgi:uncharacterized protein (TIGR00299 family) protein